MTQDTTAFAQDWLEAQRRFWRAFADGTGELSFAQAENAWTEACDQWWRNVAPVLPAPLAGQVQAALQQTRLCMRLLRGAGEHDASVPPAGPDIILAAAIETMRPAGLDSPGAPEAAHLLAWQAFVNVLADIAGAALARIRDRIERERPAGAAAVYAIYAEEVEARFRERAGGDDFARAIGNLINAQVAVEANREVPGP